MKLFQRVSNLAHQKPTIALKASMLLCVQVIKDGLETFREVSRLSSSCALYLAYSLGNRLLETLVCVALTSPGAGMSCHQHTHRYHFSFDGRGNVALDQT